MPLLDTEVTKQVLERSGGRCECAEPDHGHDERCSNELDFECQYVFDPDVPLRLKVICYSCFRKRKALRKKKY